MKKIWILTTLLLGLICSGCNKDDQPAKDGSDYAEIKLTLAVSEDAQKVITFSGMVTTGHDLEEVIAASEIEKVNSSSPHTMTFTMKEEDLTHSTFSLQASKKDDFQPSDESINLSFCATIDIAIYDHNGNRLLSSRKTIERNSSGDCTNEYVDSFLNFFPTNRVLFIEKDSNDNYTIEFATGN